MSENLMVAALIVGSAIRAGTPVLFATVGEVLTQRAGVINLGLEGAMLMGGVAAAWTHLMTGSVLLAVLAGAGAGLLVGVAHAASVVLAGLNMLASGICLFFIGRGLSGFWGQPIVGRPLEDLPVIRWPLLADLPVLGEAVFAQDLLVYLAGATALAGWWLLFRTRVGLLLRAAGEDAAVAQAEGVPVRALRVASVAVGAGLAGIGGAHLVLAFSRTWIEGVTAGRGWIAIGLVVLARWNPLYAMPAAFLFGGVMALQLNAQVAGLAVSPYLLSMLPYLFTILTLIGSRWWASSSGMPAELARMED